MNVMYVYGVERLLRMESEREEVIYSWSNTEACRLRSDERNINFIIKEKMGKGYFNPHAMNKIRDSIREREV